MKVKYRNNAATILAVAAEVGHTEMTVANGSVFPALLLNNWTYVSVEDEVVKVIGIEGNVLTCEAFVGAHDINSTVQGRITVEALDDAQDVDIYTVPGNLPIPGTVRLGEMWANAPDKVFGIGDEIGNPIRLTAITVHSSTAKYALNDVVTYFGGIYKCIIAHTARAFNQVNWDQLGKPQTPPGVIIPFIGGYFGNSSNGGFVSVHDSASVINNLLNAEYGLYVANGASLNVPGSLYYDDGGGPVRYLPNLTDDRFLMGDEVAGTPGGNSSGAHYHNVEHEHQISDIWLDEAHIPTHNHDLTLYTSASGGASFRPEGYLKSTAYSPANSAVIGDYGHGLPYTMPDTNNCSITNTNTNTTGTENRPKFLSCHYLIKVI